MSIIHNNYFYKPVLRLDDSKDILRSLNETIGLSGVTQEAKKESLEKFIQHLVIVDKDLQEVAWSVRTLDRETDCRVLEAAMKALNELQSVFKKAKTTITSEDLPSMLGEDAGNEIRQIEAMALRGTILAAREKIEKLKHTLGLPALSEIKDEGQNPPSLSDLIMSQGGEKADENHYWSNFISDNYLWNSFVFSPGKFYNMFPMFVSSYILSADTDHPERVADIISMIRGEIMTTTPTAFQNEQGSVPDRYNDYVKVPGVFANDLGRMEQFKINGINYFLKYSKKHNHNEAGREIYRLLGKAGGERFMQVCHQGIMPYLLMNKIFPLIAPGGAWNKRLPDKLLTPSQETGFSVDLKVDHVKNLLAFSMKILMNLHTKEEKTFTAHYVVKIEVSIPLDELMREDFHGHDNPAPNLHVTDTISTLIVNNALESKELFYKF